MSFPGWNVNQYAGRLICMAKTRIQHAAVLLMEVFVVRELGTRLIYVYIICDIGE